MCGELTSVSLFSGCGGLDLGLENAGFRTLYATDNDKHCETTYQRNFPAAHFDLKRIGEIHRHELLSALGEKAEGIDLLAGGPPCPPYSKSRFYRKNMPRALDDPNGLETIEGYLSVLDWVRPRAFILENVKGLSYKVHADALQTIIRRAEALGYNVSQSTLNAADFGVPQIRERFFVVGVLEGEFEFPAPTHSKDGSGGLPKWVTAGDAISDLDTEENADDTGHFAGGKYHHLLEQIPPGQNYLHLTTERGCKNPVFKWRSRYWSYLLKLSPDLPSWTIQARRSNNMGPLHWRNRILRIEEVKRLQGFPDEFWLAGTVEQQWRQIGNAVPPMLAKMLGNQIAKKLRKSLGEAA
ncbi:MAG: cytosine methyltransferase [Confluentimicrobium sp.]|nr:cytosine methyltransferase [Actibacterium sp.]|tara:strand:+ start:1952 stop:3013 length:1062 start_codon:yes stop_codon:yes gene_type:complete